MSSHCFAHFSSLVRLFSNVASSLCPPCCCKCFNIKPILYSRSWFHIWHLTLSCISDAVTYRSGKTCRGTSLLCLNKRYKPCSSNKLCWCNKPYWLDKACWAEGSFWLANSKCPIDGRYRVQKQRSLPGAKVTIVPSQNSFPSTPPPPYIKEGTNPASNQLGQWPNGFCRRSHFWDRYSWDREFDSNRWQVLFARKVSRLAAFQVWMPSSRPPGLQSWSLSRATTSTYLNFQQPQKEPLEDLLAKDPYRDLPEGLYRGLQLLPFCTKIWPIRGLPQLNKPC